MSILAHLIWSLWEVRNMMYERTSYKGTSYWMHQINHRYNIRVFKKWCCLFLVVSERSASWQEEQLICISSSGQVVRLLCPCSLSPPFRVQCQGSDFHDKSRQQHNVHQTLTLIGEFRYNGVWIFQLNLGLTCSVQN